MTHTCDGTVIVILVRHLLITFLGGGGIYSQDFLKVFQLQLHIAGVALASCFWCFVLGGMLLKCIHENGLRVPLLIELTLYIKIFALCSFLFTILQ